MINHRGDVGPEFCNKLRDFGKPRFDGIEARPQGGNVGHGATPGRMAPEHLVKMTALPSERHGQGFERAGTAATLDGVSLDLPHDGHGHVGALRKLTLAPAELTGTVADGPGNRSPVLRIACRHAPSSAFHFQRRG